MTTQAGSLIGWTDMPQNQSQMSEEQVTDTATEGQQWKCSSTLAMLKEWLGPKSRAGSFDPQGLFKWDESRAGYIENLKTHKLIRVDDHAKYSDIVDSDEEEDLDEVTGDDNEEVWLPATEEAIATIAETVSFALKESGCSIQSGSDCVIHKAALKTVRATWRTWGKMTVEEITQSVPQDGFALVTEITGLLMDYYLEEPDWELVPSDQ